MKAQRLQLKSFKRYLTKRPQDAHKGIFGHVLIIGGDYGFSGAVRMAAEAAYRVGAGLVSVATHPEHAYVLNASCPEMMCHGISQAKQLTPLMAKANIIILGPGLGQSRWSQSLFAAVVKSQKPLLLDADALNRLATHAKKRADWILTPHPGEAARLLAKTTTTIQANREAAILAMQKKYGGVIVLKGHHTLIAAQQQALAYCPLGNPGMATAGMGDVLSGVIGGLVAQGVPLFIAAQYGVLLHASAGDLAAASGERGMMATDLFPYLRALVNQS